MKRSKVLVSFVSVLFTCVLLAFSLTACSSGDGKHTHTPGEAVKENEVAATCKTEGSYDEVVYCTVCKKEVSRTQKTTEKLTTHTPAEAVKENETAATCTTDGGYDEVVYCSVCNAEISRTHKTVAKGHTPATAVKENIVAATCKDAGSYDEVIYCSVCGKELSRTTKSIDKLTTHTPATAVKENEVAATCKAEGSYDEVVHCSVCGKELSRTQKSIDKLTTHTPATAVKENETAATCKNEGSYDEVVYCSVCGKELSRTKIKTAERLTVHNLQNGECTVCGAKESTAGLEFSLNSDGKSYTVTGIGTCTASDIVIDLYNGKPVTSIGDEAFYNCTSLTSVTVGNGVTSIDDYAFSYCSSLTSVTIGNGVTSIGSSAFGGCYKVVEVINKSTLEITAGSKNNGYVAYYAKEVHKGESKIVNYNNTGYLFYTTESGVNYLIDYIGSDKVLTLPESYNDKNYVINDYAFYNRNDITSVTIGNGVTSIGDYAFSGCTGFASVIIPNSVTSIGSGAFEDCTSLTSVTIGNGVTSIGDYAFYDCTSLTNVTIPNSITSIGNSAFYGCDKLVEVINKSTLKITAGSWDNGWVAYYAKEVHTGESKIVNYNNTGYLFYTYDNVNYLIDYIGSDKVLTLPEYYNGNNYEINQYAFYNRKDIISVTIPNSVTSIGNCAFGDCYKLVEVINKSTLYITTDSWDNSYVAYYAKEVHSGDKSKIVNYNNTGYLFYTTESGENYLIDYIGNDKVLTLPENYNGENYIINDYAFYNRNDITSVTIPDSVTSIGSFAFSGCTSLKSVTIPNSVMSIGEDAFDGCTALNYNEYDNAYYLGNESNKYVALIKAKSKDITSCNINENCKFIHSSAFQSCTSLTSVTIGNSVTSIGKYAFYYCTSLTSVTIGNGVTSIGSSAFQYCTSLASVTIGSNVTSIGSYAFYHCYKLVEVIDKSSLEITAGSRDNGEVAYYAKEVHTGESKIVNKDGYLFYTTESGVNYLIDYIGSDTVLTLLESYNGNNYVINDYAFYTRDNIASVTIPNSVTSIGGYAFLGCDKLVEVINKSTLDIAVGSRDNGYVAYYAKEVHKGDKSKIVNYNNTGYLFYTTESGVNYLIDYIGSDKVLTLPESYNDKNYVINDYAFYERGDITSVTIPNSVTSIGNFAFYNCTSLKSVTIPDSVTSIGSYAFDGCSGLSYNEYDNAYYLGNESNKYVALIKAKSTDITSCTINENCKVICYSAFGYCRNLTSITIPDSVTSIGYNAFYGCTSLKSVTIGNGVTSIGGDAFYGCTSLKSITIPNNVTSIGDSAFRDCRSLTSITIPDSVTSIGDYAFEDCTSLKSVTIGNSVTSIGDSAFYGCSSLTSVTIPNSVTSIGSGAFGHCTHLTSVTIPNSVTSIGSGAFGHCTHLTSITIPDSVTSIGRYAFSDCTSLTSVTIGNGVTSIGEDAFYNCEGLTEVYISDIAKWCAISFEYNDYDDGCYSNPLYYADNLYLNGELITGDFVIPEGVTRIADYMFKNCTGLTSATIPDSVTSIGYYAFWNCTSLKGIYISDIAKWCVISFEYNDDGCYSNPFYYADNLYLNGKLVTDIVIPEGVTSIGNYALYGYGNLTSVTIPNSVTSIGFNAFWGCGKLVEVINKSTLYINAGSENNGYVAYYAKEVHTGESKIVNYNNTGYLFYTYNNVNYLLGYVGNDKDLTLPENYNDKSYEIYKYAFYYRDDITSVTIPNSVTSIGSYAFLGCTGLTSVTIGNGVTSIGDGAFYGCSSLTSVTIGNGVTSVTIGNGVTSIGELAFCYCTSLKSVTIGNGVTSIGTGAFWYCYKLVEVIDKSTLNITKGSEDNGCVAYYAIEVHKEDKRKIDNKDGYLFYTYNGVNYLIDYIGSDTVLTLPENYNGNNYEINRAAFYKRDDITNVTIPNTVTSIGSGAFYECTSLTSVTIGNGVTSIGKSAFWNCTSLTSVTIGNGVTTTIGDYAFWNCTNLTSVTIPNSVTSIGSDAFYNCESLTSVTIGNGVTSIGEWAFSYCTSLTSVTIGNGVTSIGKNAFLDCTSLKGVYISDIAKWCAISFDYNGYYDGCYSNPLYYAGNLYLNGEIVTDLVMPEGVTSIGSSAFYNCTSLTSVTIGNSVTSIGNYAFEYCTSLTSVTIGNGVTSIGNHAFYNCESLTSVTIGNGVTSIGYDAFYNCEGLTGVYISDIAKWCGISFYDSYSNPLYFAHNLYLNGKLVTELVIPESVTSISDYAFYGCINLTSVTIPNSVTSIGRYAFEDCYKLVEVINKSTLYITAGSKNNGYVAYYAKEVHKEDNSKIDNKDGYLFYTYNNVNYLVGYTGNDKDLTLPENYNGKNYIINDDAFYSRTDITSVIIPNSVTSIGGGAFYGCYKLVEVINKSTLNITAGSEDNGYVACYAIEVHKEDKSKIDNKDGYLFYTYNNVNYLIDYRGSDKVLTLPESYNGNNYEIYLGAFYNRNDITSVTIGNGASIGSGAFYYCTGLTSVTIPDSVTSIGEGAFCYCTSLTSVTIGNSVTSIGDSAFEDCTSLTSVYYKGTASEWSNVSIGSYNSYLENATCYYYSETEPTETGNYWHYGENGEIVVWGE